MFLFNYSFEQILNFTFDFYKTDSLFSDGFYGCCVVMCTLCTFIFLLWLREQIMRIGAPDWLERPLNFGLLRLLLAGAPDEDNVDELEANEADNNNDNNEEDEEEEEDEEADNEMADEDAANNNFDGNELAGENGQEILAANENAAVINDEADDEANRQVNQPLGNQVVVAHDWNPVIEWDRGAEDITWERVMVPSPCHSISC